MSQVVVAIDEAGEEGHARKVHHRRARRGRYGVGWAYVDNALAFDDDGCVGNGRLARAVDECCALQNLHAMPPAKTRPKVFLSPPCVKDGERGAKGISYPSHQAHS